MDETKKLFEDFPRVSKAEWLNKVEKDLKGKPLDDLYWHLEEDLTVDPFAHRDDQPEALPPIDRHQRRNDWEIGEYIIVHDVGRANREALEGLDNGVQSLGFMLYHPLADGDMNRLLAGIEMPYVSVNFGEFYPEKQPLQILRQWIALIKERGLDRSLINGSVDFDPLLDWSEPPYDQLMEAVHLVATELPGVRIVQVNGRYYHAGPEQTSRELGYTIAKGNAYLAALQERGIAPDITNRHLQMSVAMSTSYFVEIAKLRALKILWLNVLKAYGLAEGSLPEIVGHLAPETQDDNANTNLIRAATQAMSGVIGGVDRLYILPANYAQQEEPTPFYRRLARNVQHLLKLESHLDKVADPGAGSYYIEQLTQKLADKAWAVFQEIDEKGEFTS